MDNQEKPLLATFDRNEVFDREIKPLLDQLHELCDKHHIPLFSVCTPHRELEFKVIEDGTAVAGGGQVVVKSTFLGMQHPGVMPALALTQVGSNQEIDLCKIDELLSSSAAVHDSCKELIHLLAKKGSMTLAEHLAENLAAEVTH